MDHNGSGQVAGKPVGQYGRQVQPRQAGGTAEFKVDHVKNGEAGYQLNLLLRTVTIELEDGDFETVVTEFATAADGTPVRATLKSPRQRALTSDQQTALKAIGRAIVERPAKPPASADNASGQSTSEAAAIDLIARLVPTTTKQGKERKPFAQREHAARLLHGLHERYLLRIVGGCVWLDERARTAEPNP